MNKSPKIILLGFLILIALVGKSQIKVDSIGKAVTENFNSLSNSNTVGQWNQNSTLANWYAYEMDPYSKPIDFSGDSGTSTAGRLYSYGRALRTDRALGSLCSSANDSIVFGWRLKNNTGVKVDSIKITFTGEQWRRTSGTSANKLLFFYKVGSVISSIDSSAIRNLTGNGFKYYAALDFASPQTGTTTSLLNGNDAANSTLLSQTIATTISAGEEIMLLWLDDDEPGNDHGLAIDNISVTLLNNPDLPKLVDIDEIKQNDTNGINTKINSKVEIRGTVYGINYDSAGLTFVVRDRTNGIVVSSPLKTFGYSVKEGDSIHVNGKVIQLNGLSIVLADTVIKKGISKIGLKKPTIIQLPEEKNEANLVTLSNLKVAQNLTKWPINNFVKFLNATDTISVFIDKETDIDGNTFPISLSFTITGFVIQSSNSPKLDDGYFIVPRSLNDITFIPLPSASFVKSTILVKENDSVLINMRLSNPNSIPISVLIEKKDGNAKHNLDYISNFPLNILFQANDSNQSFTVKLINDVFDEPDKTLELVIRNITIGGNISKDSTLTITIQDNDNPLYPIKLASKTNSFGIPDSNNVKVQVKGTVYGINYRPSGLQFTIRDSSGGIGVFHQAENFGYTVTEGDEIFVSGTVGHFRGLAQLSFVDTIMKIKNGNLLKSPVIVSKLDEFSESNLVKLTGLRWVQSKPSTWLANSTSDFTNGKDTFQIRIDGDINLAGTNTPAYDTMDITGIGSQISTISTEPFFDGYLLYPRYISDIEKSISTSGSVKTIKNFATIFPNPSNGNFEIISTQPLAAIDVFSITGEILFNTKIPNIFQKSLNLDLPSGIFVLKVVSGNDVAFNRIMIK